MKRRGGKKAPPADTKPAAKPANPGGSDNTTKLLIISSVALLLAVGFVTFAIWSYINTPSKNKFAVDVLTRMMAVLKDFDNQAQALPVFDKLLRGLRNATTHDMIAFAIENTSFVPFVATHITEVAAYCTAGFSHQLILNALRFISEYAEMEKKPLCLVSEPLQVMFRCPNYQDIAPAVFDFVNASVRMAGDECAKEYLTAFCNLATFSQSVPAAKQAAKFAATTKNEIVNEKKTRVCEIVAMLTKEGQEVSDETRASVCAIADKIECSAFHSLEMETFCPKAKNL